MEYVDQIGSVFYGPEYDWLIIFLSSPSAAKLHSSILVLETSSDQLFVDSYVCPIDTRALQERLEQRDDNIQFRNVIFEYSNVDSIDKSALNTLGHRYSIHPEFFHRHFGTADLSSDYHDGEVSVCGSLPGKSPSFDFGYLDSEHVSIVYISATSQNPVPTSMDPSFDPLGKLLKVLSVCAGQKEGRIPLGTSEASTVTTRTNIIWSKMARTSCDTFDKLESNLDVDVLRTCYPGLVRRGTPGS